jgi:hypothetical protein
MYEVPRKPSSAPWVCWLIRWVSTESESPVALATIGICTRASCWLMSGS